MENIYKKIIELQQNAVSSVVVTVVETSGPTPASVQSKIIVSKEGLIAGTIGGGNLEFIAIKKAKEVLKNKNSILQKYILNDKSKVDTEEKYISTGMICGGTSTLFFEYVGNGKNIFIFGAGHICKALCYHLSQLNYSITVFDDRPEILEIFSKNKYDNVTTKKIDYSEFFENKTTAKNLSTYDELSPLLEDSFIIIATPTHRHDYKALKGIYSFPKQPFYIGLIASKNKAASIHESLKQDFPKTTYPEIDFSNLYMPIGLNTGGRLPEDIAISIVAQIQTLRYKKENAEHLKIFIDK